MEVLAMRKNRRKLELVTTRKEYTIYSQAIEPYWNEGINFYPKFRKGFKNPKKRLMSYQIRMYRTWKYNRVHQWK